VAVNGYRPDIVNSSSKDGFHFTASEASRIPDSRVRALSRIRVELGLFGRPALPPTTLQWNAVRGFRASIWTTSPPMRHAARTPAALASETFPQFVNFAMSFRFRSKDGPPMA
jgi:hypothetical protein